jgi:hypothetical protein
MAGMSPAGNIPSGATDQEKVFKIYFKYLQTSVIIYIKFL